MRQCILLAVICCLSNFCLIDLVDAKKKKEVKLVPLISCKEDEPEENAPSESGSNFGVWTFLTFMVVGSNVVSNIIATIVNNNNNNNDNNNNNNNQMSTNFNKVPPL